MRSIHDLSHYIDIVLKSTSDMIDLYREKYIRNSDIIFILNVSENYIDKIRLKVMGIENMDKKSLESLSNEIVTYAHDYDNIIHLFRQHLSHNTPLDGNSDENSLNVTVFAIIYTIYELIEEYLAE